MLYFRGPSGPDSAHHLYRHYRRVPEAQQEPQSCQVRPS